MEELNAACLDAVGDPKETPAYSRIKEILDSKEKIPHAYRIGTDPSAPYFNFWQDEEHVQGIWRRTSLESYIAAETDWTTV
eukprot:COSAG02_NODE_10121_length_2017_cov_1.420751_1_plen_80_part_10